jgi:hypothetical protein
MAVQEGSLRRPDVVVTGTGRSGTSFCCYVLHVHMGICMHHKYCQRTPINPKGRPPPSNKKFRWPGKSWESHHIGAASWGVGYGHERPEPWLEAFQNMHTPKRCKAKYVGCKNPQLIWASEDFWNYVKPQLLINCVRSKAQVLESMNRWAKNMGWDEKKYEGYLKMRDMARQLPFYLEIDFSEEVTPEELKQLLQPYADKFDGHNSNRNT